MKEKINAKVESTKKFVKKHKTLIAYSAGVVVGVSGMAYVVNKKSCMELTEDNVEHLRNGGVVQYDSPWGDILTWIKTESVDPE